MSAPSDTHAELQREIERLRSLLEECEGTLRAIRSDEVDALLVHRDDQDQVLVLDGVDRPYRLMIERMQQGAATSTADGTIIYSNRRLADLVGVPPESLAGQSLDQYATSLTRPVLQSLLEEARERDAEREIELRRSDGSSIPALITASPLLAREQILCLVVTDLTQQKRQEAERERLIESEVARAVAEETAEELRAADRRKDEFLAMLAHELRSPLAPLRNGLEILNRISSQAPDVRQVRDMMSRQLASLVRLVDDLLDVGRVTQGKIKLRPERIDLKDVVDRAIESCRGLLDHHRHELHVALPSEPLPVEVDVVRATQIVVNLLSNAVKFTPPGGRIALVVEPCGVEGFELRVRDNGIGIAPEMLPRVFDLFTQADPTASRTESGLGIGLTLARRLVEMHGGVIDVSSDGLGKGSEFRVRLPASVRADQAPAAAPPAERPSQPSPCRVLVVDDNRDAAESLAALLRMGGHDVRHAHDGMAAMEIAQGFEPELVLLDIGLPGMSGYDVAARLRSQASARPMRIVAISGYGGADDRQRSLEAGFDAHFVKPVELASLESQLAAATARARSRSAGSR